MRKHLLCFTLILTTSFAKAQILIPLLFGDKINQNESIEFGIQGGFNLSSVSGLSGTGTIVKPTFGIYLDYMLKETLWIIHAGFLPLSTMGASNLHVYPTGNAELDKLMDGGEVRRVFNYFSMPLLIKYKFKNAIYLEGGTQLGLMYGSTDKFFNSLHSPADVKFFNNVGSQYRNFDIGINLGVGYRLPFGNGLNLSARSYWGLMNIAKTGPSQHNRSYYLMVGFPVGAGK